MVIHIQPGGDFWVGDWFVQPSLSRIAGDDCEVHVTPRAMAVLVYLARADGAVVSRSDILDAVWPKMDVSADALTQCIVQLRKAFGDTSSHPAIIETIPKVGVRLIPKVTGAGEHRPKPVPAPGPANWRLVVIAAIFVAATIAAVALWTGSRDDQATVSIPGPEAGRLSIAVLPFSNDSVGDENLDFFASGIHNELISRLARVRAFNKVISRTSVMEYLDTRKDVQQIASELGVGTLLEGHVQRADNRVHVNVRLIDASSGALLWAESYDREPSVEHLFVLQSEIARNVAQTLQATLTATELGQLDRQPTSSTRAYQFYLSGRDYARGSDLLRDLPAAVQQFERAAGEDPRFALALAYLSITHIHMYWTMDRTEDRRGRALASAQQALEIEPELPDAHLAMAWYHYQGHLDYEAALRELAIAEPGMPEDAELWFARGAIYRRMGRWNQAVANLEHAVDLDPRNANLLRNLASSYMMLRDYAAAEHALDGVLELAPDAVEANTTKAAIPQLRDGDDAPLLAATRGNPLLRPGQATLTAWFLSIRSRDHDEALRLLDEWNDDLLYESRIVYKSRASAYGITYRQAGQPDLAREYFQTARVPLERAVAANPGDARLLISLGEVLVGLGEAGRGKELALEAMRLMPTSREAMDGPGIQLDAVLRVLAPSGDVEAVVEHLDAYLSAPGFWSIEGILVDPRLDPVRNEPEFVALVAKHSRQATR